MKKVLLSLLGAASLAAIAFASQNATKTKAAQADCSEACAPCPPCCSDTKCNTKCNAKC